MSVVGRNSSHYATENQSPIVVYSQINTVPCLCMFDLNTDLILDIWTKFDRNGVKVQWVWLWGIFVTCVDLEENSLCCLFSAHWAAKGQTRCTLSGGGGSGHGRPGRYQEGISRLCLDDRTLPASLSLLSVHRRPSASVSCQPAQHDNRTKTGDEASAVNT